MRHHIKTPKRRFFYIETTLDEPVAVSKSRPTPYEMKIMSIRPIPGTNYTEVPKRTKRKNKPVPVWWYIAEHGAAHFDAMLATGRIRLIVKAGVNYCQET